MVCVVNIDLEILLIGIYDKPSALSWEYVP